MGERGKSAPKGEEEEKPPLPLSSYLPANMEVSCIVYKPVLKGVEGCALI